MSNQAFQSLDINQVRRELQTLFQQVASNRGRVELNDPAKPDEGCVLISKRELESLEKALEMLADADGVKALAQSISHACEICNEQVASGS